MDWSSLQWQTFADVTTASVLQHPDSLGHGRRRASVTMQRSTSVAKVRPRVAVQFSCNCPRVLLRRTCRAFKTYMRLRIP